MKRRWIVYMLRCRDGSLYTGITVDLEVRLARHSAGKASKYTRSRLPVKLAWSKAMLSATAARKREAEIKGLPRTEKLRIIGLHHPSSPPKFTWTPSRSPASRRPITATSRR